MATTALYRLTSNEVVKISPVGNPFSQRDTTYWGVLTDPTLTDGNDTRDPSGNLRVLGYAKIRVGTEIRNATQPEIDTFAPAEAVDESLMDRDAAKVLLNTHPVFRKMMTAFADIIKDEINILRAQHSLPDRTLAQLKTAMLNRMSEND